MKKIIITGIAVLFLLIQNLSCYQQAKVLPKQQIANMLIKQMSDWRNVNNRLIKSIQENKSVKELQHLFLQSRLTYKKTEWAAEYFVPIAATEANGAPVPEIEASEFDGSPPMVVQPDGLQIMESLLYPEYDTSNKKELIQRLEKLNDISERIAGRFKNISLLDWQVFDAVKLEIFRLITLGITGFDAPVSLNNIEEASYSLSDLKMIFSLYLDGEKDDQQLIHKTDAAMNYLNAHRDNFNGFDRAEFITAYANLLSAAINHAFTQIQSKAVIYNRFLRQSANTLFDADAFNVNAFVASFNDTMTDKKVALGKVLFFDPVLSGNKVRSCGSCHQPDKSFCDNLIKNTVYNSNELLPRNTPTLLNAALQSALFYDSHANTLELQAKDVMENKNEMHGSLSKAAIDLWKISKYREMFGAAFPKEARTMIHPDEIQNALASYVRSLVKLNSRFDEYMRGNKKAMNQKEINGFNLFMGKAKCATCHYMPLFNGMPPPKYIKTESEIIGVLGSTKQINIDSDLGRYNILKDDFNKHAFKIPTVRNISKTYPYMHNGIYATLEEVMDFYNKGGGHGLGIDIENQTLPFDKLNLSTTETEDIIAFMKALDSQ